LTTRSQYLFLLTKVKTFFNRRTLGGLFYCRRNTYSFLRRSRLAYVSTALHRAETSQYLFLLTKVKTKKLRCVPFWVHKTSRNTYSFLRRSRPGSLDIMLSKLQVSRNTYSFLRRSRPLINVDALEARLVAGRNTYSFLRRSRLQEVLEQVFPPSMSQYLFLLTKVKTYFLLTVCNVINVAAV